MIFIIRPFPVGMIIGSHSSSYENSLWNVAQNTYVNGTTIKCIKVGNPTGVKVFIHEKRSKTEACEWGNSTHTTYH